LGTAAWFILGKNNSQKLQPPPTPSASNYPSIVVVQSPPTLPTPPTTTPANDMQLVKSYSVEDIKNASLSKPYSYNGMNFYITDEAIVLTDGSGAFSYCDGSQVCGNSQIKKATVNLSNITIPSDPSILGNSEWGGTGGVMILGFDFNGQRPNQYYLATFDLNRTSSTSPYVLYTPPVKNLGIISGTVKNIGITNKGEITVDTQTDAGLVSRVFSITSAYRYYDITELTPDKSGKIYDDTKFGYNFTYPADISASIGQTMEDPQMESDLKVSPLYHADECGLQPTFADGTVYFWAQNSNNSSINLNANLTVHQIGPAKLYLTSALYGYDPADWGQVKQTILSQDYTNAISSGASITGKQVNQFTIGNLSIRHIAPFVSGKPCDNQYREQYQWVSGNLMFNLIFTDATYGAATNNALKTKLINSIFSSLNVK
jgi:hypothetical protein